MLGRFEAHTTVLPHEQVPSIPEVPQAIITLLEAARRLEDSIRRWGLLEVAKTDVRHVFVDIGNMFHEVLAAFSIYSIDIGYAIAF